MRPPDSESTLGARDLAGFLASAPEAVSRVRELVQVVVRSRGFYIPTEDRPDVVQQTLLSLWQAVREPGFDCRTFEGLVRTFAYRRCVEWMRRKRSHVPMAEISDPGADAEQVLLASERRRAAKAVLDGLRPACRELLRAHILRGLSYRQIAEAQGRSEGALRTAVWQCLKEARELVRKGQVAESARGSRRPR